MLIYKTKAKACHYYGRQTTTAKGIHVQNLPYADGISLEPVNARGIGAASLFVPRSEIPALIEILEKLQG